MNKTVIDDAEEASFSLNGMVAGFDENTSAYAHMPTKNPYSHFCFALNIEMTAEEVIAALKKYLEELERGECREVLCIEKKMMRKEYWAKDGLLRRNLLVLRERLEREKMVSAILRIQNGASYDDFLNRLEDSYAEVARLLSEIHRKMMKMTRKMYGQFYQYLKLDYESLGKHLFQYYYKMTDEDRQAFFDLDVMMELINKDIAKVMPVEVKEEEEIVLSPEEDALLVQLQPMFYGSEDNAKAFLGSIQGMKGKQITDMVNMMIAEKKLSELSCHRDLYTVLHDAGIYDKSESNWNMQVR